jgi:hypothetical protein
MLRWRKKSPSTFASSSAIHRYLLPFASFPEEKDTVFLVSYPVTLNHFIFIA